MKFKCNRCRKIFATRQAIGCGDCRKTESRSSDGTMLTEVNHLPNWAPSTEYTVINDSSSWSGGGGSYGGGGSGGSWSDGGSSGGSSGGGGGGD